MTSYFKYTIAITIKDLSVTCIRMGIIFSMSYQSINKDKYMPTTGK
jgi:hypothetical protein